MLWIQGKATSKIVYSNVTRWFVAYDQCVALGDLRPAEVPNQV